MVRNMDRCDGACCEKFLMTKVPSDLLKMAEELRGLGSVSSRDEGPEEIEFVADMMLPRGDNTKEGWALFTCRYWDQKTRLCSIYEWRPRVCRDYGAATPCEHPKCRWRDAACKPREVVT